MAQEKVIEKDGSLLFRNIDDVVYAKAFKELDQMRKFQPHYRDDQLLMFILCNKIVAEQE